MADLDQKTLRQITAREQAKDEKAQQLYEELKEAGYSKLGHAVRSYCMTHIAQNAQPVITETEGLLEVLASGNGGVRIL